MVFFLSNFFKSVVNRKEPELQFVISAHRLSAPKTDFWDTWAGHYGMLKLDPGFVKIEIFSVPIVL